MFVKSNKEDYGRLKPGFTTCQGSEVCANQTFFIFRNGWSDFREAVNAILNL